MNITKPAIVRLARCAGIKNISEDCYDTIRQIFESKLDEIIKTILIVNSEHQTKTIMQQDIYDALEILGYNVAKSTNLGLSTCTK